MNLLNPVLSVLYPVFCGVCFAVVDDRQDGAACSLCWDNTRLLYSTDTVCGKCGRFHSSPDSQQETFCRRCDDHHYDLARSCGFYENALAETVISLKTKPTISQRPADLMWETFSMSPYSGIDLLIPIPLSKRRFFERTYNQAETIAKSLSKLSGIPVDAKSLARKTHTTASRAALDRKGRELTVRNAFIVQRANLIKDKRLLLIDDVYTSGATASMAAKALKKEGAARVDVLTLARAGLNM